MLWYYWSKPLSGWDSGPSDVVLCVWGFLIGPSGAALTLMRLTPSTSVPTRGGRVCLSRVYYSKIYHSELHAAVAFVSCGCLQCLTQTTYPSSSQTKCEIRWSKLCPATIIVCTCLCPKCEGSLMDSSLCSLVWSLLFLSFFIVFPVVDYILAHVQLCFMSVFRFGFLVYSYEKAY